MIKKDWFLHFNSEWNDKEVVMTAVKQIGASLI